MKFKRSLRANSAARKHLDDNAEESGVRTQPVGHSLQECNRLRDPCIETCSRVIQRYRLVTKKAFFSSECGVSLKLWGRHGRTDGHGQALVQFHAGIDYVVEGDDADFWVALEQ